MIGKPKDRTIAILLAFAGLALPGIHKFYLGRPAWGLVYLLPGLMFWGFPIATIPRIASLMEGVWYLLQGQEQFNHHFNPDWAANPILNREPGRVEAIAQALRQLESLRQEGLITEYEFEQQRRQLLGS
uniref:TM2 domain containing protein n=1 Tax=Cyanothece sp. (strain PCC 7425 / ATCC 29141) TaxID=395961 RepID=B8HLH6_CYAP4